MAEFSNDVALNEVLFSKIKSIFEQKDSLTLSQEQAQVNPTAQDIPKSIKKVGVFVNESLENVKKKAAQYNLNTVQLHGREAPEFCGKLKNEGLEIIKVFSIRNEFDFSRLSAYEPFIDFFLFDTKGQNPGGNGFCFDWNVLRDYDARKPYFLSGGIGVEQLESLKKFKNSTAAKQCHAIDINSKFELKPGLKDDIKLKDFIEQL